MNVNLTGKRALVTGASRGIGEAIARRLAESGAHVILAARGIDQVNQVAAAIKNEGFSAEGFELDITADNVRERVRLVLDAHPSIDILVNNAGITDDVLWSAVFLASEQAGYITGIVLNVSGGLYT